MVWFFYPKIELPGLILDKTVLDRSGVEHRSFNWITTNNKYVKPDGSQYDITEDYYGFFPINRPEYVVKDLTVFNKKEIDSLARSLEYLYYTDAYGIYTNEWVYGRDINERSRLIYGGLSQQSYLLFEKMFRNRKLVITEFNNIASPTSLNLRFKMQRVLESDFSGWTGRYYHSLDTLLNPDIPGWLKRLHRRYYKKPFAYPDIPGIVLVHETERVLVLQAGVDLEYEIPILHTNDSLVKKYNLPEFIRYPYWFDVNFAKDSNNVYATYKINTNSRGDSILASQRLPNEFPAILADHKENLRWYFCGDWADSPTPFGLSYFKGVQFLRKFFYNNRDELDREKFFWEYYEPLVSGILEDYIAVKDSISGPRELPPLYPRYVPYYRLNNMPLPDIDLIASGRVYDPEQVLGTQYKERAYRDSVLRAEREEAARTGFYIGEYGDTVYLSQNEIAELEAEARFEQESQGKRDSINQRRLDSIRGDGQFDPRYRMRNVGVIPKLKRGGRMPMLIPLSPEDLAKRDQMRDSLRSIRVRREKEYEDSLVESRSIRLEKSFLNEEEDNSSFPKGVEIQIDKSYLRGARVPSLQPREHRIKKESKDADIPKELDPEEAPSKKEGKKESEPVTDADLIVISLPERYQVGGRQPLSLSSEQTSSAGFDFVIKDKASVKKEQGENQTIVAGQAEKSYHLIIASFTSRDPANKFLKKKVKLICD